MKGRKWQRTLKTVGIAFVIALLGAIVAYAAGVDIDLFESGGQDIDLDVPANSSASDTDVVSVTSGSIDTERDLYVKLTNGSGTQKTVSVDVSTADGELSLDSPSGTEYVFLQVEWDGTDGTANSVDEDGLSAVDLTSSGDNDGIRIRVLSHDVPAVMTMTLYSGVDTCSDFVVDLPGGMSNQTLDVFMDFTNDFSKGDDCSTAASEDSVTAVVLQVMSSTDLGGSAGPLDLILDFADANDVADYGDLPLSDYGSSILNAHHTQGGGNFLRLGSELDTETTHNASDDADGDDTDEADDEDGVVPVYDFGYFEAKVVIEGCPSRNCYINGWIDWEDDGDFSDTGEHFIDDQVRNDGTYYFSLNPPSGHPDGYYYLRFRVCDASGECDSPSENATNGEVEDYKWYMDEDAVELSAFSAAWQGDVVEVVWETAMEIDTAGFNLWRATAADGDYVQVNDALIPSASPGQTWGGSYAFTDQDVTSGSTYFYKLEELEVGGARNWYGPTVAEAPEDKFRKLKPVPILPPRLRPQPPNPRQ
jgi:hypothetical protein